MSSRWERLVRVRRPRLGRRDRGDEAPHHQLVPAGVHRRLPACWLSCTTCGSFCSACCSSWVACCWASSFCSSACCSASSCRGSWRRPRRDSSCAPMSESRSSWTRYMLVNPERRTYPRCRNWQSSPAGLAVWGWPSPMSLVETAPCWSATSARSASMPPHASSAGPGLTVQRPVRYHRWPIGGPARRACSTARKSHLGRPHRRRESKHGISGHDPPHQCRRYRSGQQRFLRNRQRGYGPG